MEEYLEFVSIDTWTLILTWVNLVILYLLLKKFLFKPINKMLDARGAEIEKTYTEAERAKAEAEGMRADYERKLTEAKTEADGIIKTAVETASSRSDDILREASSQAKHIIEKSHKQIEQDKKAAVDEARKDVASMAVDVAEKLIGKKLNDSDDERLISDIIDRM